MKDVLHRMDTPKGWLLSGFKRPINFQILKNWTRLNSDSNRGYTLYVFPTIGDFAKDAASKWNLLLRDSVTSECFIESTRRIVSKHPDQNAIKTLLPKIRWLHKNNKGRISGLSLGPSYIYRGVFACQRCAFVSRLFYKLQCFQIIPVTKYWCT